MGPRVWWWGAGGGGGGGGGGACEVMTVSLRLTWNRALPDNQKVTETDLNPDPPALQHA